jgi:V8-like Glu-specific endopeptidase
VQGEQEAMKDLISTIKKHHKIADTQGHPCSGIVYVHKRDDTTMISSLLRKVSLDVRSRLVLDGRLN